LLLPSNSLTLLLTDANLEYQEERPRPEYLDEIFHKVRRVEVELIAKKIDIRGAIKAFIAIIGNDECEWRPFDLLYPIRCLGFV
jgi:hypothetical protein